MVSFHGGGRTRWPGPLAAGVTLAGMTDLGTFFAGTEPWIASAPVAEYGEPVADRVLLAARFDRRL